MVLAQDGSRVRGTYGREVTEHPIEGTATADEFTFRYTSRRSAAPAASSCGATAASPASISRKARRARCPGRAGAIATVCGTPISAACGSCRRTPGRVFGLAEYDAAARIEGEFDGTRLTFKLEAGNFSGRGVLDLDPTGYALSGEWLERASRRARSAASASCRGRG